MASTETAFKKCSVCGTMQRPSNYHEKAGSVCKNCVKLQSAEYRKEHKTCSRCKKTKLRICFSKDPCQKSGLHPYCKECVSIYGMKFRNTPMNKEQRSIKFKEYYYANRDECLRKHREYYRKNIHKLRLKGRCKKIGITVDTYNDMFEEHDGYCDICGISESDLKKPLFIDHDHDTGDVRGLLCPNCNSLLGHARDNLDILISAYSYLNKIVEKRGVS